MRKNIPFYNWYINLPLNDILQIGNNNDCNVIVPDVARDSGSVLVCYDGRGFFIDTSQFAQTVYIDGTEIHGEMHLEDRCFIEIGSCTFYYNEGDLLFDQEDVRIRRMHIRQIESSNNFSYPKFVRNSRQKIILDDKKITILDPPSIPSKPEQNIVLSLLPAVAMIALVVILRGVMDTSNNSSFILYSVGSMTIGLLGTIGSFIHTSNKFKKDVAKRVEVYNKYVDEKTGEIEVARNKELNDLRQIYRSTEDNLKMVHDFDVNIFDRTPMDEDFLDTYIGVGERLSCRQIDYKIQEKLEQGDELFKIPEDIHKRYAKLIDAPITMNMRNAGALGIAGGSLDRYDFFKTVIVDIVSRQYHSDMELYLLLDKGPEEYEWVCELPQVNDSAGNRRIVYDVQTRAKIFESLYRELTYRAENKGAYKHIIVFVLGDHGLISHPISRFVEDAAKLNVTFVFFARATSYLPLHCSRIIELNNRNGCMYERVNINERQNFRYSVVPDTAMYKLTNRIAPVYCEEISLESTLRKSYTFFESLGISDHEQIASSIRWGDYDITKSISAALGINAKNELVVLDLHEKVHGPHGLVAGTTGSGKSEMLLSFILGLAMKYPPSEIGFLIIDFKGGGMITPIEKLPHLLGAITNIDGKEINRSLKSIRAELMRRQILFDEAKVNHIDKYIAAHKAGRVMTALPHLVIVVDEFAELRANQPDFMKELISAARVGRSLGVHLILATQKPAGQVDEQIASNMNFRICLKVQTPEDSKEVIKTPLAAEIHESGRAYLKVGHNEMLELFQSAYSGGPALLDERGVKRSFAIYNMGFSGPESVLFEQKADKSSKNSVTEQSYTVDCIAQYSEDSGIKRLLAICMPSLPDNIQYSDNIIRAETDIIIPIGIYDDPDNQAQRPATVNISSGNMIIVGSSQYGKTNLLQLLIRSVAHAYSPDEVNMYVLDFGSMALKVFDGLNHIGGVVIASEDEKLKNFFRMILAELQLRKAKFASLGITSFHSYREAGYTDMPQIMVMIDNFIALKELYPDYEEDILFICKEGMALGLCTIITSLQSNGISYKFMSTFPNKLCLFCNGTDQYSALFDRCRMQPKMVPGRALVQIDKDVFEAQTFLAFTGEREIDRVREIKSFINSLNTKNDTSYAKRIPEVPDVLDQEYVTRYYDGERICSQVITGINFETVEFTELDLMKTASVALTGDNQAGKLNYVGLIMRHCFENVFDYPVEMHIIDDYNRDLEKFSDYGFVEKYTVDAGSLEDILVRFEEELQERKANVQERGMTAITDSPQLILVINNNAVFNADAISRTGVETYKNIVSNLKSFKVQILFANIPNVNIAFGSPELLKSMKDTEEKYIFGSLSDAKLVDVSNSVLRRFRKPLEIYDAYRIIGDGDICKIRTVIADSKEGE